MPHEALLQTGSPLLPEGRELYLPPSTDENTEGPRNYNTCLRTESPQVAEATVKHTWVCSPLPNPPHPAASQNSLGSGRTAVAPGILQCEGGKHTRPLHRFKNSLSTLGQFFTMSQRTHLQKREKSGAHMSSCGRRLKELIQTRAQQVEALMGKQKLWCYSAGNPSLCTPAPRLRLRGSLGLTDPHKSGSDSKCWYSLPR